MIPPPITNHQKPTPPPKPTPLIIAHRGASAHAPENTLAAFTLAWRHGADAIETDLRLTADGEVVALHDPTLTRTTGVFGRLGALTLADLRVRAPQIPTLAEVLAICPPCSRVVLELKEGAELLAPIAAAVATRPDVQPTFIAFDHDLIAATKARFPSHPALWLLDEIPPDLPPRLEAANLDGVDLRYTRNLTQSKIQSLKSKIIYVFTVNDRRSAFYCRALGVDGITTDRPAFLKSLN